MDSRDVAQYRDSPTAAGSSHSRRVFFSASAYTEFDMMEKTLSISGSFFKEKGRILARERGRKAVTGDILVKCSFIDVPRRRERVRNKREERYRERKK